MDASPPPIAISALEHAAYCPRQCALIVVDGVWADNRHTVRGSAGHQRADDRGERKVRCVRTLRAVPLFSDRHGLVGRADVVEVHDDGSVVPVEYKMGRCHPATKIQLCAQGRCLEEMTGRAVTAGFVWEGEHRRRLRVPLSRALRSETVDCIAQVRSILDATCLPSAPNDERCVHCQLRSHCLPDVVSSDWVEGYLNGVFR